MKKALKFVFVSLLAATILPIDAARAELQGPGVEQLVLAARTYLESYVKKASGVAMDEALMLTENANAVRTVPTRVSSELVLLNVGGQLLGMRDVYAVDTKPLRPKDGRITRVLAEVTPATWMTAQQHAREHAIYLRGNAVLWFSDPVLVTRCLSSEYRPRLTFKLEGSRRLNGVQVYGLGFKETDADPARSILQMPTDPLVSGRFWVEADTGRIHQTEFWPQSKVHSARVQVMYTMDEKLGVLLPASASHTFESRDPGMGMSGTGGGGLSARITFESTAQYSAPRYTPIDLSKFAWRAP